MAFFSVVFAFAITNVPLNLVEEKTAEKTYNKECANCHKKNGEGIKRIYPPLKNSDYVANTETDELIRGIIFGRKGIVTVNGIDYPASMKVELSKSTTNKHIALLVTYIYQEFNGLDKRVTEEQVRKIREKGSK